MLFNSIEFAIFLPIVFVFYWFVASKKIKLQNLFILTASYVFYGWWDLRFLFLIIFSSSIDYLVGIYLGKTQNSNRRKTLLLFSVVVNLGLLSIFKYYNFFIDSFTQMFTIFGFHFNPQQLDIILPIGISFYTFQTLSYSIDVYKGKLNPTKNILAFFCFVSFFPQLVAGPIERASNLLPQFLKNRVFSRIAATDGLRQILWGLFKKMVIADNCARYVDLIFEDYQSLSGSSLFLGLVLFAFQIYGDFSGYSDIAIGTARLFGFNFKQNFAFPYFSRNIGEFWRRWHISLSTWFRDYLYIPLGGSKGPKMSVIRNVFIVFLVSGLWHGANMTFIVWGFIHALYFIPLLLLNQNRKYLNTVSENKELPSIKILVSISVTFFITTIAWVFFRAESMLIALEYLERMFTIGFFDIPKFFKHEKLLITLFFITFLIVIEWLNRSKKHALETFGLKWNVFLRLGFYYGIAMAIFLFGGHKQEFIYFQF